jgi:hypothetical protein
VTADVQRELAEKLVAATTDYGSGKVDPTVDLFDFYGEALLPTVQALIERAEKRAAARALREAAEAIRHRLPGHIGRIDTADTLDDRAAALDPAGVDSEEGR